MQVLGGCISLSNLFLFVSLTSHQYLISFLAILYFPCTVRVVVDEEMRDRMERLVLLPFSIGCVSESSVALGAHQPRTTTKHDTNSPAIIRRKEDEEESLSSTESMKSSLKLFALSKPNISSRFHRLFKTLAQLFVYREEEMEEVEMEIGVPTDLKHVTHIGWDISANTNPIQGWDNLIAPELFSLQSPPVRQFELVIAAQAAAAAPPPDLVRASSA